MDGRERGFIVIHRRVRSSALYRSLTAEQRSVFYTLLLLANWKDRQVCVGGAWETIHRGEILQSLKTIAAEADVSVKVVRTTLAKMFADDRPVGGQGPFLTERWIGSGREVGIGSGIAAGTVPGTATGTPIRVLTVVNYGAYQTIGDDTGTDEGTGSGIAEGTPGARQGHARGTTRTKGTKETSKALGATSFAVRVEETCPNVVALLKRAAEAGFDIDLPVRDMPTIGGADALVRQAGIDAAAGACVEAAKRRNGGHIVPLAYLMGPLRDAVAKRAPGNDRGRQQPGQDWTATITR